MKRLIFIILSFLSLSVSAQYTIQRPIPGRVVYPVMSGKVIQINFTNGSEIATSPNWNNYLSNSYNSSLPLIKNDGISSGWSIIATASSTPSQFNNGTFISGTSDFPTDVINTMWYVFGTNLVSMTLSGLNTAKTYTIYSQHSTLSSGYSGTTSITVAGSTQTTGILKSDGTLTEKLTFSSVVPDGSGNLIISFSRGPDNNLGVLAGLKIIEN